MGLYEVWHPSKEVFIEIDNEMVKKLHFGDPIIGWRGDPNMEFAYNKLTDRIELWQNCEDGTWKLITESRPGMRLVDAQFLMWLRDHDPLRGYNAFEEIEKRNKKLKEEEEQKQKEAIHESADRIAFEIRKRS